MLEIWLRVLHRSNYSDCGLPGCDIVFCWMWLLLQDITTQKAWIWICRRCLRAKSWEAVWT